MNDHWKGRNLPNLEHITSLFDNEELGAFITGHLILESVLVQLIELKLPKSDSKNLFDMNFPSKVQMGKSQGLFNEEMVQFLLELNRFRNRLAHRLGESINFDRMYALAQAAHAAGVDFSDETIFSNKATSLEWYGVRGIIQEVFQNTIQDLSLIMEEHGGEFQFS